MIHRSGHAEVLNSAALLRSGSTSAQRSRRAVFGHLLDDGRLDGLVIGMAEQIEAVSPALDPDAIEQAVRAWAAGQAAAGVTTLVDAGLRNGAAEWATFERLVGRGAIPQAVVAMEGVAHLGELPSVGADGGLRRGVTKLQPPALEGERVDRAALLAGL